MGRKRLLIAAIAGLLILLGAVLAPEIEPERTPVRPDASFPDDASAPRTPEPPARSCVIRVTDDEGRPCRAEIHATGLANRPPDRADFIGETGADGRLPQSAFRMKPRGSVFALAPGRAAAPVPLTETGADLVLGDGVVVTGTVLDRKGEPLCGVVVKAEFAWRKAVATTSDRQGRFRLTGLVPGAIEITGWSEDYRKVAEAKAEAWDQVIDVELSGFPEPGNSVLVDVRYATPPTADPRMLIRGEGRHMECWLPRTDALVRVDVSRKRTVEVVCPGFKSAKARLNGAAPGSVVRLDLEAGGGMPHSLLVVDPDGLPVPGALVLLTKSPDDHYPNAPRTGPDGRLPLSASHRGRYAVASASAGASREMRIEEGADEIVLELLPAAVFTGRVLDRESGAPACGVWVRLKGGDCACCSPWLAITDENGEYRFAGIPAGLFVQVYAALPDMQRSHLEAMENRLGHLVEGAEQVRFADLLVTRHASFKCRFRIEPALPGEVVWIDLSPGGTRYPRLGEDGVVTIDVRAGDYLFLIKSGVLRAIAAASAEDLAAGREIEVKLEPPPRVTAVLVDAHGKPLPFGGQRVDAEVVCPVDGESRVIAWGSGTADSAGLIDLTGEVLPSGPAGVENVLSMDDHNFRFRDGPLHITAEELRVRLEDGEGEVRLEIPVVRKGPRQPAPIVVVDPGGRPVAGVRIGDPDDPEEGVETDRDGRASVKSRWEVLFPFIGNWERHHGADDEPRRLVVERARRIRLRILGPNGEPLDDAFVDDADYNFGEVTDENGRVELVFPARIETVVLRCDGYWLDVGTLPRDDTELEVRALRRRGLDVVVRGPKELAVERGIRLEWEADVPSGTERKGEADAGQAGGVWRARVSLPPFPGRVRAFTSNLRYEGRAPVAVGTQKIEIELARLPEHEVVLVFLDPDGRPLAGREIDLDHRSFTTGALVPRPTVTDDAGRLVLRLPEGSHELCELEVGEFRIEQLLFAAPANGVIEVRFR
jgi:hypothetical protein